MQKKNLETYKVGKGKRQKLETYILDLYLLESLLTVNSRKSRPPQETRPL